MANQHSSQRYDVKCHWCGSVFSVVKSRRQSARYCSADCRVKAVSEVHRGNTYRKGSTPWNKGLKGIHISPETEFQKGMTPWNKGKTGYMGANDTSFKKGNLPPQTNPKGHVSEHIKKDRGSDGNYTNIDPTGERKPNYRYARYVWEKHHGQSLPKDKVIYHLNGDKTDDRIGNLVAISRAELLKLNREGRV